MYINAFMCMPLNDISLPFLTGLVRCYDMIACGVCVCVWCVCGVGGPQVVKRTVDLLFVRGDGIILISPPLRTG